jgi:hypothetical protein
MQVQLSDTEYDFMMEAMREKFNRLLEKFTHKEPTWEEVADIAESEFEKELEKLTGKKKSVFAYKPRKAPYGLKKDGTPAKKRGRKS